MEAQAALIVGALVLAFVLWVAKTVADTKQDVAVIHTILVGAKGENGVAGDVRVLKSRVFDLANLIHGVMGKQALQEERMDRDGRQDRRDDKP